MAAKVAISIDPAVLADLQSLAEINRASYAEELITRIAYPAWPDVTNMRAMFLSRIEDRLTQPETRVYKAVDIASGQILGFACWTLEGDDPQETAYTSPTKKATQLSTAGLNLKFVMAMGADAEALSSQRKGTKHYYLSAFAVSPQHQGKGIGTQLLRHCTNIADRESVPAWLTALPGSHSLYLRSGFTDMDHKDVDLNAWDDFRCRGYGVYRTYAMIRQPRKDGEGCA